MSTNEAKSWFVTFSRASTSFTVTFAASIFSDKPLGTIPSSSRLFVTEDSTFFQVLNLFS